MLNVTCVFFVKDGWPLLSKKTRNIKIVHLKHMSLWKAWRTDQIFDINDMKRFLNTFLAGCIWPPAFNVLATEIFLQWRLSFRSQQFFLYVFFFILPSFWLIFTLSRDSFSVSLQILELATTKKSKTLLAVVYS